VTAAPHRSFSYHPRRSRFRTQAMKPSQRIRGPVAGLLAAGSALGFADLASGLIRGTTSPVVSVGSWVIDHVPSWMKTFAVRRFGTNDKPALIIGTLVLLALFATVVGILARRRLAIGLAGVGLFGLIGAGAAMTRPFARAVDVVPSLLGAAGGMVVLWLLIRRIETVVVDGSAALNRPAMNGVDRRGFLTAGATVAVVAAGSAVAGRSLRGRFSVASVRTALKLPTPKSSALPVPTDVEVAVPGVAPFMTSNENFYRIDTTLITPQVDPTSWRLTVKGMVDKPFQLTYAELLKRDMVERDITLVCVSNEVGGNYVGTARWLGVPLKSILEEAGVKPGADQLVSRSVDGWTAGSPVAEVMDGRDALVAIGMNGQPLPVEHGFPARLIVPGLYGFVSATKWLAELELSTFAAFDPYWAKRGWAKRAPIKTMARIDTPRGLQKIAAGKTAIAGVTWAIHRGIEKVEVRIDNGDWMPCRLAPGPSADTWRQWVYEWDATPGTYNVSCRATDGSGQLQTDQRAQPIPDGASGWHSIVVIVE
jgi:DMSO/TMAO reductase YedYZ molybdopterin-dependent catalytic subunit